MEPTAELPADAQAALVRVESLVGIHRVPGDPPPFRTCPMWYVRLDWVHDMARTWRWWRKGQLGLIVPRPSQVLVDAINAIEDSTNARELWEIEQARSQTESENPPPKRPPGV